MTTTFTPWQRAILFLDMNAFFASIEQLDNPHLRGKPIGITNGKTGTCIITASYEARRYGIKTGMRLPMAKHLCPHFIQIPSRPKRYAAVSSTIMEALKQITPDIEIFSVDEAFLDLTPCQKRYGDPILVAKHAKTIVWEASGLLCSVGLSGDKTTAKFAGSLQKPDGFTVILPWETQETLANVPVTALCGIGDSIGKFLKQYGVITCGDMAKLPISVLGKRFGHVGRRIWLMCQGKDPACVNPNVPPPQSMGHGKIMPPDTKDWATIQTYLLHMCEKLGARLRRSHMKAQHFFVGVRQKKKRMVRRKNKNPTPHQ